RRTFEVYSPKVVAGISQIPRVLQTRAFQIEMRKKKKGEATSSFQPDRLVRWSEQMRDTLALFALRNARCIAQEYGARDRLDQIADTDGKPVCDDRLRDILAPIYAMAAIVDREAGHTLASSAVDSFAVIQAKGRNSDGGGDYALAAHALFNWAKLR